MIFDIVSVGDPTWSPPVAAYRHILGDMSYANTTMDGHLIDLYVLLVLYYGQGGEEWTNTAGWATSASICTWLGVFCNAEGYVTAIRLPNNGLTQFLVPDIGMLSNHLTVLDLSSNELGGLIIPGSLRHLAQLEYLNFSRNEIKSEILDRPPGQAPQDTLGSMEALRIFDVSRNSFHGTLLPGLDKLAHLEQFFVDNNNFSGTIPTLNWTNVQIAQFDQNNFTGSIDSAACDTIANNMASLSVDCDQVSCDCCSCPSS